MAAYAPTIAPPNATLAMMRCTTASRRTAQPGRRQVLIPAERVLVHGAAAPSSLPPGIPEPLDHQNTKRQTHSTTSVFTVRLSNWPQAATRRRAKIFRASYGARSSASSPTRLRGLLYGRITYLPRNPSRGNCAPYRGTPHSSRRLLTYTVTKL